MRLSAKNNIEYETEGGTRNEMLPSDERIISFFAIVIGEPFSPAKVTKIILCNDFVQTMV